MKTSAFLLAGLALAMAVPAASAAGRETTITGPAGAVIHRDVDRSPGAVDVTTTGPQGRTVARSLRRSPEGAAGTVTGPRGRTVMREVAR